MRAEHTKAGSETANFVEGLVHGLDELAHVVDGENDHAFHPLFADPLGRDQLRKIAMRIPRIVLIQVGQAISVA